MVRAKISFSCTRLWSIRISVWKACQVPPALIRDASPSVLLILCHTVQRSIVVQYLIHMTSFDIKNFWNRKFDICTWDCQKSANSDFRPLWFIKTVNDLSQKLLKCCIGNFHRFSGQNCTFLSHYAASTGNLLQTFRDDLSLPSSKNPDSWLLKMGPIGRPETSVRIYHYSLSKDSEERSSCLLRGGSLKFAVFSLNCSNFN